MNVPPPAFYLLDKTLVCLLRRCPNSANRTSHRFRLSEVVTTRSSFVRTTLRKLRCLPRWWRGGERRDRARLRTQRILERRQTVGESISRTIICRGIFKGVVLRSRKEVGKPPRSWLVPRVEEWMQLKQTRANTPDSRH